MATYSILNVWAIKIEERGVVSTRLWRHVRRMGIETMVPDHHGIWIFWKKDKNEIKKWLRESKVKYKPLRLDE